MYLNSDRIAKEVVIGHKNVTFLYLYFSNEIKICRFRRDVLEGTLEEMLEPEIVEKDSEEEQIPERWLLR